MVVIGKLEYASVESPRRMWLMMLALYKICCRRQDESLQRNLQPFVQLGVSRDKHRPKTSLGWKVGIIIGAVHGTVEWPDICASSYVVSVELRCERSMIPSTITYTVLLKDSKS